MKSVTNQHRFVQEVWTEIGILTVWGNSKSFGRQ